MDVTANSENQKYSFDISNLISGAVCESLLIFLFHHEML